MGRSQRPEIWAALGLLLGKGSCWVGVIDGEWVGWWGGVGEQSLWEDRGSIVLYVPPQWQS